MDEQKQNNNNTGSTPQVNSDNNQPAVVSDIAEVISENTSVTESVVPESIESVVPEIVESGETVVTELATTSKASSFNYKVYGAAVAAILLMSGGLLFVLEKEGRVSTGLFTGVIAKIESAQPAAMVNGVVISKTDFNSSYNQLVDMTKAQGADVTSEEILAQLRTQAVDTLINAELLRQAAVEAGETVTSEQVETRFTEISDGLGGKEALTAKMTEFGVTEASLRRDIENEFLIQGLFDNKFAETPVDVSETEIADLYNQASASGAELPPLPEVREQIVAQIKFNKEQEIIAALIEELKAKAEVEVSI